MMLRFTVELVPHGDESRKERLGSIEVFNDGSGSPFVASYGFRRFSSDGRKLKEGAVGEFKRSSFGPWQLFQGVLGVLFPDEASPWRDGAARGRVFEEKT
jgi:hypothetical protein